MVHPGSDEVHVLKQVAREIRDATDESGYRVGVAVGQHRAFSHSRMPTSSLERSLVLDAARRGASQAGLGAEENSGGLDIIAMSDATIRRYRVKRVKLTSEGDYEVLCGAASSLLVSDPELLYPEEKWILGYITSDDHTIDRLIAAEIVDWRGTGPVRLIFGTVIDLAGDQPPREFKSTDEGLDGFDEGDGDAGSADAG